MLHLPTECSLCSLLLRLKKMLAFALVSSVLLAVAFAAGCSSSPPVSVSLSSSSTQTDQGQTIRITAALTSDSSSQGVTWSLAGPGSLSGQAINSVTYNAPRTFRARKYQPLLPLRFEIPRRALRCRLL
jgi:hypothetical protein